MGVGEMNLSVRDLEVEWWGMNLFEQILEEVGVGVEVVGLNLYVLVLEKEVKTMWTHC